MKINYVVRIYGNCSAENNDVLKESYPNRGFSTAGGMLQYIADIAKYCEETFGVRNIHIMDDDERGTSGILIGLNSGVYDDISIDIEQCDFLVKEP